MFEMFFMILRSLKDPFIDGNYDVLSHSRLQKGFFMNDLVVGWNLLDSFHILLRSFSPSQLISCLWASHVAHGVCCCLLLYITKKFTLLVCEALRPKRLWRSHSVRDEIFFWRNSTLFFFFSHCPTSSLKLFWRRSRLKGWDLRVFSINKDLVDA